MLPLIRSTVVDGRAIPGIVTYSKTLTQFLTRLHDKGLRTSLNLHPADGIRGHEDCYERCG